MTEREPAEDRVEAVAKWLAMRFVYGRDSSGLALNYLGLSTDEKENARKDAREILKLQSEINEKKIRMKRLICVFGHDKRYNFTNAHWQCRRCGKDFPPQRKLPPINGIITERRKRPDMIIDDE